MKVQDVIDLLNRDIVRLEERTRSANLAMDLEAVDALGDELLETRRTLKKIQSVVV